MRPTFAQDARWIVMPLPRVTKPTIGSGGAGLQQRASPVSSRSTPTTRMPCPRAGCAAAARDDFGLGGAGCAAAGCATRVDRRLHLLAVDLVARERGEQILGLRETRLGRERLELERRLAQARELALDHAAALRDRLVVLLRLEPLAHLGARAVALHVAEVGIQPVARRARPASPR